MKKLHVFLQELFYVLTAALAAFSLMELFWERIVLAYINLNWVLILWILNAIILLLLSSKNTKNE